MTAKSGVPDNTAGVSIISAHAARNYMTQAPIEVAVRPLMRKKTETWGMEIIMSTISNATALQNTSAGSILGRLAATPKRLCVAFITWRVQQAAINRLKSMSERELKDIGLSRSQIESAVIGESARDHVFSRYY